MAPATSLLPVPRSQASTALMPGEANSDHVRVGKHGPDGPGRQRFGRWRPGPEP